MKFYFCETCGKRVTEQDVEAGRARNKKLKGVFCSDCAVGVMTMEMEPISEVEAHKILNKTATPAVGTSTPSIPPANSKRESSAIHVLGERKAVDGKHAHRVPHAPHPPEKTSSNLLIVCITAGICMAGALAYLVQGSGDKRPRTEVVRAQTEHEAPEVAVAPIHRPEPPAKSTSPAPVATDTTKEPVTKAPPSAPVEHAEIPLQQHAQDPVDPNNSEKTPVPVPRPIEPAAKTEVAAPIPEEKTQSAENIRVPVPPAKPSFDFNAALSLALSGRAWSTSQAEIRAQLDNADPAEQARIGALMDLGTQSERVSEAILEHLRGQAGKRMALTMANSQRRLVAFSVDGKDVLVDMGEGMKPLDLSQFAPFQAEEFARAKLGEGDEAQIAIAAWDAFHGDATQAERVLQKLPNRVQAIIKLVMETRQTREREKKSNEETARFLQLKADGKSAEALAVARILLQKYSDAKAVKDLQPALDLQIAELEAQSSDLHNVFLCDAKSLPDGRVSLSFDFAKPQHMAELVNRGMPPRFLEVDGDITLSNDSRWERIIQVGDAQSVHSRDGKQSLTLNGKQATQELKAYNPNHDYYGGPVGGSHRYRFKAGPQGFSCQIDDDTPLVVPGAWKGGVIRWPGHYVTLPSKLSLTGRLDPLWLAEMSEVAKERTAFLSGAWVNLKPAARRTPLDVSEIWFNSYSHGSDKEKRTIIGWHECGAAWHIEGQEWVSPPADYRPKFHARFWPMALAGSSSELAFEARSDKGFIEAEVPGEFNYMNYTSVCLFPDKVSIQKTNSFDSEPGTHGVEVIKSAPKPQTKPGQWQRIQLIAEKGKLRVLVEGVQVIEHDCKIGPGTWAFWSFPGCEYRLRNMKLRKTE